VRRLEKQASDQRAALLNSEAEMVANSQRALQHVEAELAAANARATFDCQRADDLQQSLQQARRDSMAQVLAVSENAAMQTRLSEVNAKLADERRKVVEAQGDVQKACRCLSNSETAVAREASAHEETRRSLRAQFDGMATMSTAAALQTTTHLASQHELQVRLETLQATALQESTGQLEAQRRLQERLNSAEAAATQESKMYQESQRLLQELKEEGVPCHRIVVNQLLPPVDGPLDTEVSISKETMKMLGEMDAANGTHLQAYCRFCETKRKDQKRALQMIRADVGGLQDLKRIEAPLFDLEIRGVPALRFFGDSVWL